MYKLSSDDLLAFGFKTFYLDGCQEYTCPEKLREELGIDVRISHRVCGKRFWEATAFHNYKGNDFEIRLFDVSNMTPKAIVDLLVEMRSKFFEWNARKD